MTQDALCFVRTRNWVFLSLAFHQDLSLHLLYYPKSICLGVPLQFKALSLHDFCRSQIAAAHPQLSGPLEDRLLSLPSFKTD